MLKMGGLQYYLFFNGEEVKMIPYGRQSISEEDIRAVVDVLKSDFLTQGRAVPKFEKAICEYTGSKYAIAVNSCTSALHIACLALGLGDGDILWTTPTTFVGSANCGLYCGAQVDFVDIDPVTWNLSIKKLKEKLIQAKNKDCLPKILVAVHLCGLPCDMEAIAILSKEYDFSVIEDAAHAIGGRYKNEPVGSCRYSDITTFSFHPVKTITTGEGGMAVTNNQELSNKMELLRSHGITRDTSLMTHKPDGPWYYQQVALGFNYRLTDIQAALGYSQLLRLDGFVKRRHEIARQYNGLLKDLPLRLPNSMSEKYSGLHLYVVRIQRDKIKSSHKEVFEALRSKGIGVNLHYIPVHTHPYYQEMGFSVGDFPESEAYYQEALSLPIFPDLTDEMQQIVVDAIREAL